MLSKNMYSRVLLNLKKKGVIVAKTYLMLESGVKKKKSWYEIKSFLKTVDCHADITVLTDAASLTD